MLLDVYYCQGQEHEFAVKDGEPPLMCPFCGDFDIDFSHEVDLDADE